MKKKNLETEDKVANPGKYPSHRPIEEIIVDCCGDCQFSFWNMADFSGAPLICYHPSEREIPKKRCPLKTKTFIVRLK